MGIACTIVFTAFVVWFVVVKVKPLTIMLTLEKENRYEEVIEKVR